MQKRLQLPEHKLIIDVSTRWNSALEMVVRFLEQQPAIYAVLSAKEIRGREKDIALLSDTDISLAEELVVVLTPLQTATKLLCDESMQTVSVILPLQHQLLTFMQQKDGDSEFIKNVKAAITNDLSGRYQGIKSNLTLSALIDPRFKLAPFLTDDERLDAYHQLTVEAVSIKNNRPVVVKQEPGVATEPPLPILPALPTMQIQSVAEEPPNFDPVSPSGSPTKKKIKEEQAEASDTLKHTAMSALFGDVYITNVEPPKSKQELVESEVSQFKREPPINANESPLMWWKTHSDKYPTLALVAKKYLCIPATSVPSERVFSNAGDIVTAQRSCLKPKHVDMLIFLKKNWKPANS